MQDQNTEVLYLSDAALLVVSREQQRQRRANKVGGKLDKVGRKIGGRPAL